jgi:hypothetical protein
MHIHYPVLACLAVVASALTLLREVRRERWGSAKWISRRNGGRRAEADLPSAEHDGRRSGRKPRAMSCREQGTLAVVLMSGHRVAGPTNRFLNQN